jgi:hypothetical protein
MLFALRQPATLLGLVLGFAVGCFLRAALQQAIIGGLRSTRRLRDTRLWVDPYGVVGALLGGMGWSTRPEVSRFRARQVWLMVVAAVVVHGVLTAAGLAGYLAAGGTRLFFPFISSIDVIHGTQLFLPNVAQQVCLGFGIENLACGLLALVPIPPLELGVALWSTLPKSTSARRMAYRVLEEQWGVAIILVLMLLPLAGQQPLLLKLIGDIADRVVHAL